MIYLRTVVMRVVVKGTVFNHPDVIIASLKNHIAEEYPLTRQH